MSSSSGDEHVVEEDAKEEQQRRLSQARGISDGSYDKLTTQRLAAIVAELENQLSVNEASQF